MKIRLHLKIFIFIAIFVITRQIKIYSMLMIFAIIHELGHMIAGIILGFKPSSIDLMPFGISIGFESNIEDYNTKIKKGSKQVLKKIIIATAGPLTNIMFVILFLLFDMGLKVNNRELIIYSNILLALFNLIPIYPLDGGRILKGIIHIIKGNKISMEYTNKISNASIIILTAVASIGLLYLKNVAIVIILAYLWYLIINENKKYTTKMKIYKKLEMIDCKEAAIK